MAANSHIQWTESTWNPWYGCHKVSKGCKYCYMFRERERYGADPNTVMRSKTKFYAPKSWQEPKLIFTCSWSDFFVPEADAWRDEAWKVIRQTPQHTYQILTKRPERIEECLPLNEWNLPYIPNNIWMGVTIETQEDFDARWGIMEELKYGLGQNNVFFISFEPLLGPIDVSPEFIQVDIGDEERVQVPDWAIIGGESGNDNGKYQYRPMEWEWAYALIDDLRTAEIPVFVKQLGTDLAKRWGLKDRRGGDINEWPEQLQIREMPEMRL